MRRVSNFMIISTVITGILIISLITFFITRSTNKSNENKFAEELASFEKSEGASTEIGKSVEEAKNTIEFEEIMEDTNNTTMTDETEKKDRENENTEIASETATTTTKAGGKKTSEENKTETKKDDSISEKGKTAQANANTTKKGEIDIEAPIKGEIIREYAKDSLVFSKTLQEWVTHTGVDIKADKTTVVKAAASGKVSAIKNDPRYGLTVIINHDNGYQTIYSNLLTAEFVVEGEKVEKGQSIGTVGNTASFESSDDSHLHFEILKDNEHLDPAILIGTL